MRVTRGVWRPGSAVDDLSGRVAAVLSVLPSSVAAGRTAAELHGLFLPPAPDRRIELILRADEDPPEQLAHSRRREIRGRRRRLAEDEVGHVGGIPVTTIERTWVDLAEVLALPDLVAAGDCALRAGADPHHIEELLRRARHRRGVVRAREAVALLDARSRSRPESHLRVALVTGGLPRPAVNAPVYDVNGQWLAEPDLSYDDVRLAIEYNGAEHASPARMRRDITRELDLQVRGGWRTVTFGPAQVFRRPDEAVAIVRTLRRQLRQPA